MAFVISHSSIKAMVVLGSGADTAFVLSEMMRSSEALWDIDFAEIDVKEIDEV